MSRDAVVDKTGEVYAFMGSGGRAQQSRTNSLLKHVGVATTRGGVQIDPGRFPRRSEKL